MKKHNISKVVLVTILIFLVLTWIIPAAYYSGEYVDQGRVQMGLFDLFSYPLTALSYFGYIALFLILVGGFYGVLFKIPAYRSFLDKIVDLSKGKEKVVLSIMVVLIALLVSICGAQIGVAIFIPFVVSLILLMGYDKIVAAFVTVGSISAGLIGNTYATSNSSILTNALGLNYDFQIGVRFVLLLVAVVLVIFNMLMYIKKTTNGVKIEKKTVKKVEEKVEEVKVEVSKEHKAPAKKSTSKSTKTSGKKTNSKSSSKSRKSVNKAALKDEDIIVIKDNMVESDLIPKADNDKHLIWPFGLILFLIFVLYVLAFLPWASFGVTLFDDVTKAITDFELFGFPIFAKILGSINSFGNWSITDMFLPLALSVLLLSFIYNLSMKEIHDGFVEGAKRALAPAAIVVLLYSVLVLVTYHPFQLTVYKTVLGFTKGFNIVTTGVVAILCGLFNSDIAYSFQSVAPYYASVITKADNFGLAAIIFQSLYGLTMLVAPTSLALLCTLSFLNVSYKEWFKMVAKLLLELFVILLIVFIILAVI